MNAQAVLDSGVGEWLKGRSGPPVHVVRVPIRLFPISERDVEGHATIRLVLDPLIARLVPKTAGNLDATYAIPPYPTLMFDSGHPDDHVMLLLHDDNHPDPGEQTWLVFLFACSDGIWIPTTASTGIRQATGTLAHFADVDQRNQALLEMITRDLGLADLVKQRATPLMGEFLRHARHPVMATALTLVNLVTCRNVRLVPQMPAGWVQRARKRRQEGPAVVWHEVVVTDFRGLRVSLTSPSGYHLPHHWVRGHFKRFSVERPLFGQYSGQFWWHPHLAGKDKQRRVDKAYRVPLPGSVSTLV